MHAAALPLGDFFYTSLSFFLHVKLIGLYQFTIEGY